MSSDELDMRILGTCVALSVLEGWEKALGVGSRELLVEMGLTTQVVEIFIRSFNNTRYKYEVFV